MSDSPRSCKTCGTTLTETNTYPSDWRRHVNLCKACKQKTFSRLRERQGGVSTPQPSAGVSTPDAAPPPQTSPEASSDPDEYLLTPEEIEILHDLKVIRKGPTWKKLVKEGELTIKLRTPRTEE